MYSVVRRMKELQWVSEQVTQYEGEEGVVAQQQ